MLDDREQRLLREIERSLLDDPRLCRRLASRGPRPRRGFVVWGLVTCVGFLVTAAVLLVALGLAGQSLVLVAVAVWPAVVLRRRTGWPRRPRGGA